ncbi:MAG: monovalent cation/H+ antiporter subunit D family protein [Pseudomonadota bacterium]
MNVTPHLPVLVVIAPLMAAPLAVAFASARLAWWLAFIVSLAAAGMSFELLASARAGTVLSYAVGDWPPPWGIELRVDRLNALVLALVSTMSAVVLPFARASVGREVSSDRVYLFYACWMLCLCGLLGMTVTGDAFNVFVFLEISSLSTYTLVSLARRRQALLAAFRYLIMGTVGATFILIGIVLIYMMTGTLNMADMSERMQALTHLRPVQAGAVFILVGVALKMALFPMHMWLPGAYYHAPMAVTAFLAATATKVAVYLMLRFSFTIFGPTLILDDMQLGIPLALLGGAAALVGSLLALANSDVKRILAYSSLAQIGYMALGIATGMVAAVAGAILHLVNHAIMKSALFMALGAARNLSPGETTSMSMLRGAGRRMPWTMAGFTIAAASLVGIPFTAGFLSKWYLIVGTFERGWWPLAALAIMTSLMAAIYMGRLIEIIWMSDPGEQTPVREAGWLSLVPVLILAAASVYFGVSTDLTAGVAFDAARTVLAEVPK